MSRPLDIFLSYNREDHATAGRFAAAFEREGFSVWWDAALRSGEAYDEVTEKALREAKAVVVLWSKKSVASRWVRAEATIADRNKTLVPAMIEPCERPLMFELTQTAELAHWDGATTDEAWLAFLADVRRFVDARATPALIPQGSARSASAGRPAILILPFVNLSGDAEQEYFSDGVTEDIITDLGRIAALSVVSRNAAFALKGKTIAAAQIGREQNVSHILEGSIRKSGKRIRITAQLVEAATDAQLWAERFDRTLDDIFAIQDEISRAIVSALKVKLAPAEQRALDQRVTPVPEAYELFLLARQFSRTGSERMQPLIARLCRRIVELDPGFALAWAHLSFAEGEMAQRGVPGASSQRATDAARKALELGPNLAEAHTAMAEALGRGPALDLLAGEPYIETALRLDPQCYEAHLFAGYLCLGQRRYANSIAHFEAAIALDPVAYRAAGMVVQAYTSLGDGANVRAASHRLVERCEKLLAVEPDHSGALGFLVTALADLGEGDRARELTRRAVLFDPDNTRLHYNLACGMATLQEVDLACTLLADVLSKVSTGWLIWVDRDSSLDPIRGDPRFIALMARLHARHLPETEGSVP
ncbi:MAG: TIR domain-containing protein [Pseudomonadota bacterium]